MGEPYRRADTDPEDGPPSSTYAPGGAHGEPPVGGGGAPTGPGGAFHDGAGEAGGAVHGVVEALGAAGAQS
jgi:hypothetical protein